MEGTKGLLESKTVWGVLLSLIATFAPKVFGFEMDAGSITWFSDQLAILGGGILAIYGRVKAFKKIGVQ